MAVEFPAANFADIAVSSDKNSSEHRLSAEDDTTWHEKRSAWRGERSAAP